MTINVNTRTLFRELSTPNQRARSRQLRCQHDTSSYYIHARPMGAILLVIDVKMQLIDRCQTTRHNLMSYRYHPDTSLHLSTPNQWERSRQLLMSKWTLAINWSEPNYGHNLMSYRCQPDTSSYSINAKPMGAISACMFQWEPNYSVGSNQIGVSISTDYISSGQIRVRS